MHLSIEEITELIDAIRVSRNTGTYKKDKKGLALARKIENKLKKSLGI